MGRTAAVGWKQMALPRATTWSQRGVCSQGWSFCGGPEDHLGTPEAAGPRSSSKCHGQRGAPQVVGCCCGAGHHGGSLWVSMGDLSSCCCSLVFMQEDACSLQEQTGHLVAFLSKAVAAVSFAAKISPSKLFQAFPHPHTHTEAVPRAGCLILLLCPMA